MGKTIAEKIFDAHSVDNPADDIHVIRLDAVFCHEITTPLAMAGPALVSTTAAIFCFGIVMKLVMYPGQPPP